MTATIVRPALRQQPTIAEAVLEATHDLHIVCAYLTVQSPGVTMSDG